MRGRHPSPRPSCMTTVFGTVLAAGSHLSARQCPAVETCCPCADQSSPQMGLRQCGRVAFLARPRLVLPNDAGGSGYPVSGIRIGIRRLSRNSPPSQMGRTMSTASGGRASGAERTPPLRRAMRLMLMYVPVSAVQPGLVHTATGGPSVLAMRPPACPVCPACPGRNGCPHGPVIVGPSLTSARVWAGRPACRYRETIWSPEISQPKTKTRRHRVWDRSRRTHVRDAMRSAPCRVASGGYDGYSSGSWRLRWQKTAQVAERWPVRGQVSAFTRSRLTRRTHPH